MTGDDIEGFSEVFKYAMKFTDLDLSQNFYAYQTLVGKKMLGDFGLFRGVQVPQELADELLDDLPYIELLYRYFAGSGFSVVDSGNVTLESKTSTNPHRPQDT